MAGAKLIDQRVEGCPRIDRYEVVAEIASGGMATVYLGRLSGVGGFQRFLAIKRLHPHLANEDEFVRMFLDEARLAAGIHHPNVVPILEVGAGEQGYYLVMEYVEGATLSRLLAQEATAGRSLPTPIALRIVADMLAGLHAAHELRDAMGNPAELVHRDVSPQNVLVGVDGISRISDFGVARAATRLSASRVGQLKGKIAYMSPEQASGQHVDRRADVFASGIVLWESLVGRRLFKAHSEAATIALIVKEEITSPQAYDSGLSQAVVDICMRALERDRDARFATAMQFADALEQAAATDDTARMASHRETASYVTQAVGQEISQQREAVRAWVVRSQSGLSQAALASSVSVAAVSLPTRADTTPTAREVPASDPGRSAAGRGAKRWLLPVGALLVLVVVAGAWIFASLRGSVATGTTGEAASSPAPRDSAWTSTAVGAGPVPGRRSDAGARAGGERGTTRGGVAAVAAGDAGHPAASAAPGAATSPPRLAPAK